MKPEHRRLLARIALGALRFVARYGVLAAIWTTLLVIVLGDTFGRARPRLQLPIDGFVSQSLRVELGWSRGDAKGPLVLEVSQHRDFAAPLVRAEVTGTSHTTRALPKGEKFYWRVEQSPRAQVGVFRTAPHAVAF